MIELSLKKILFFFSLLLFFSSFSYAGVLTEKNRQDAVDLSAKKPWLKLMHYSKGTLFGYKSRVDGHGYFFSSDGKTNPQSEILASLEAFNNEALKVGRLLLHPQCAFPYRYRFLKSQLNLQIKDQHCPSFDQWISGIKPKSVTVVYASGYANNPVSVFGHLFLRINSEKKKDENEVNELLDHGVGYEAVVEGGFSFMFPAKATLGGYNGQFAITPYYLKVQEYSNFESRDLWEYHLSLTKEEVLNMLTHVWELETNTFINYYFKDENCAFQLLALIEAIKPEWDLTDKFSFYVMPAQSVRVLAEQRGAVREVTQRLSLNKRLNRQIEKLNLNQRQQFDQLISGEESKEITDIQVLEVAALYFAYKKQSNKEQLSQKAGQSYQRILTHRAQLGGPNAMPPIEPDPEWMSPDKAHKPFRAGLLAGVADSKANFEFHYKVALHDLLNYEVGYAPYSRFDFMNIRVRYQPEEKRVFLKDVDFLRMESFFPLSEFEKEISWRVAISLLTPEDLKCFPCREAVIEGALGGAIQPMNKNSLFYVLIPLYVGGSEHFAKGYRWGPGFELGGFFKVAEVYRLQALARLQTDLLQEERSKTFGIFEINQSFFISPHWDMRLLTKSSVATDSLRRNSSEVGLQLNHYF